jgi:sugar phosphate isomerase/epimerase
VDVCYEIHPGEDLHDGVTFERFLALVDNHPRCNMLYDPATCICSRWTIWRISISTTRVSSVSRQGCRVRRNGRSGVYGGYQNWQQRAGRFRSLGDGQIDFKNLQQAHPVRF